MASLFREIKNKGSRRKLRN